MFACSKVYSLFHSAPSSIKIPNQIQSFMILLFLHILQEKFKPQIFTKNLIVD